jgi:hypothetical protein
LIKEKLFDFYCLKRKIGKFLQSVAFVTTGPLPPPEKRWEVVLSSSNPQISETGMAMAQEYFARGQCNESAKP